METSEALREDRVKILGFIDGNENLWGNEFNDFKILEPKILLKSNISVIIASANHYGEIVNSILSIGVCRERIIPNFVL